MKKLFNLKNLVFISSIFITVVAEIYSIYGLSKLFSGHKNSVIIMAISLAFGKIIVASLLKLQWNNIELLRKIYLLTALVVLSLITSLDIYGFLSDGYQTTKRKDDYVQTKIELVRKKKSYFEENSNQIKTELLSVNKSVEDLRKSLSTDNQTQQVIKGQLITNIVSSNKTGVQKQIDVALLNKDKLEQRLLSYSDSIQTFDLRIIELEQSSDVASELGPLKFVSSLSGLEMDRVVNYFLLFLIFVFDPLALVLLWSYFSIKNKPVEEVTDIPSENKNEVILSEEIAEPQVVVENKKPRKVTKTLGRPRKQKNEEINNLIDSVINPSVETVEKPVEVIEAPPIKPKPPRTKRVLKNDLNPKVVQKLDQALEEDKKKV